ncbi:hypothetical protein IWW37_005445 [Coemansia sp. RSA 2050]|nr:hypothetical protein IWW37_005445 [Coemansia sp. RSA 2050]KAJ2730759.1 hypothetical protein IW152_005021 [Coemansia sp. BCRC 34962]
MLFKISTIAAALVASVSAHMSMVEPCTRYTAHNPKCPALPAGKAFDYNLKDPLGYTEPLCKHTTPYATPVATWTAGQSITARFEAGGAAHGGGHIQFSLSYDGGKTFVVIHEVLKHAFFDGPTDSNMATVLSYTFDLPKEVPASDKAIFAWTWVNAIGNREFYMNCADVAIKSYSNSFTGKRMTIANHEGYPTIDEFKNNYDTGIEHYKNAPLITVTGSGSATPGGGNPPSPLPHVPQPHVPQPSSVSVPPVVVKPTTVEQEKPTNVVPVPTYIPSPVVSTPPVPKPTGPPTNSGCTHGVQECTADGSGFKVCVWGVWSSAINCAPKTKCKALAPGTVNCDWP